MNNYFPYVCIIWSFFTLCSRGKTASIIHMKVSRIQGPKILITTSEVSYLLCDIPRTLQIKETSKGDA